MNLSEFIFQQTNLKRAIEQRRARTLLFEGIESSFNQKERQLPQIKNLLDQLSEATDVFFPEPVQQEIYSADTGTHIMPEIFKNLLADIKLAFIIRPGCVEDLRRFVIWAGENRCNYTVRGAGTYPFGGCVPLKGDVVVDLSYLDFLELDEEQEALLIGAGVLFPDARKYLQERGYALRQETTNRSSGTIAGWIATGGIGLGSFKYGHVKESVLELMILQPDGELITLRPGDERFDYYFGSEGQFGIIVGAALRVRKESFVQRPFAFSFKSAEDAHQFMGMLYDAKLNPTSIIYFDPSYLAQTYQIEKEHIEHRSAEALKNNDQLRLTDAREDYDLIEEIKDEAHVVLLHFDEVSDYQQALKSRLFGSGGEQRRVNHITYRQLTTAMAHLLWEHRFLPVQMKQKGPSLLVSETILPFAAFPAYQHLLRRIFDKVFDIELKYEAHLLPNHEILVQSIFLADTRTLRHKIYFALVPLMAQVAHYFGAKPYGIGLWNYFFMKKWRQVYPERAAQFSAFKKQSDPHGLINQGKFLNPRGQKLTFKIMKIMMPAFSQWFVSIYHKRLEGKRLLLSYPLEKLVWKTIQLVFPRIVPPHLKANGKNLILEMISVCAECDSCERVCPTSDVFGLYGPATPITRRLTAHRIATNQPISQREAYGFLACTRCDNCTHICPTNINLTKVFDLVEADERFQNCRNQDDCATEDFVARFWQIMKQSPLYREHTLADQKDEKSHLSHGVKLIYEKGFEYSQLFIDPLTCIRCGMCSHENACMYGAREGHPRQIPELKNINCALCNACVNYCPQNKLAQKERIKLDKLILHAPDLEEKKYWIKQQNRIHDTTKVQRSTYLTEMADRYVTEEIIMEIDKEASTGKIPVSGSGQGDRHQGIGFDAERFAHFHIVGPAQNRLHEGDPDEELSVILGKREDFCKFDREGNLVNPIHPTIKLMTPILYNAIPLESNGKAELAFIKVAEKQKSLVVITLERLLEHYQFFLKEGKYERLPAVIIPRVDHELIHRLMVNPRTDRDFLIDLWRMPVFEVEYHPQIERTLNYIFDSVAAQNGGKPLICGYLEISEYDLIGSLSLDAEIKEKVNHFLDQGVDMLHLHGLRNKDEYYVTSMAVRALHHYLMRIGRRHEVSIIASGGIRLASDTQKTIQRGAEATLIDFAALLALDPSAYKAKIEKKATTEKLLSLDIDWAVKRLNNQAESRKVQILEVLGASGFKDLKKTVGEEGRLIDFIKLENRIQRQIFEDEKILAEYARLNDELIQSEPIPDGSIRTYSSLKNRIKQVKAPHDFYRLGDTNQNLYKRDFVWPGQLIESMGRMAAGDLSMLDFKNVKATGLLGDGFDVMRILYNRDPMDIPEAELDQVKTAMPLDKNLVLEAPWMFGGKSVGSIGLDTWRAHVVAARELGIQFDTGEGGYPTCFFLNSKGEPIFFTENEIQLIKPYFQSGQDYTVQQMRQILSQQGITPESHPEIYQKIQHYPSLKPFHFTVVVDEADQPFVSTELKTGLFGVTKQTIKKARRIVIAYSQGAKMGIGGHILAQKVNKLVSYMRGVEGIEQLNLEKLEGLFQQLQKIQAKENHPLKDVAGASLPTIDGAQRAEKVTEELKDVLWQIQETAYNLNAQHSIDPIEFQNIVRSCEEIIQYSYSSIISPFPFHNCYSIEDVKAFIDVIRMINPEAVIAIKVSPSIDIEFIATGLARIAKDNTEEIVKAKFGAEIQRQENLSAEMAEYARKYGMKIEIWLDGPRGGTGASPNIIKGQMGMHIEYAIPLIHNRLVKDGLRNYVKFMVSGGIRTYEDVIKAVALGADGVIWGTAPLVAIGCDRNRNCHDGCSRGIATSNLILQKLRDVDLNTAQMINAFTMIQMQVTRALAALGFKDIRELRGRFDAIHWMGLKERVDHRYRIRKEVIKEIEKDEQLFEERMAARATAQSNCGVAAINGTVPIPGYILDQALTAMRNRGMDGVGMAKTLCFPDHPDDYAYRIMVKGTLQIDVEKKLAEQWQSEGKNFTQDELQHEARSLVLAERIDLISKIKTVFLDPYFDYAGEIEPSLCRERYKSNSERAKVQHLVISSEARNLYISSRLDSIQHYTNRFLPSVGMTAPSTTNELLPAEEELDYRNFGDANSDPGDIFRFFVRVKKDVLFNYIENDLLKLGRPRFLEHLFPEVTLDNYRDNEAFLQKAEDMFVFHHSLNFTRILYVCSILPNEWDEFLSGRNGKFSKEFLLNGEGEISVEYLTLLWEFIQTHPYEHHKHRYDIRSHKIAAVMSCGKNFAVWKTAGREIPWQTPDAPNNIIHVRLATGSVVEQMNAHPFAKLHTALTHNGETTNYEALKQRVEQFNLSPLATTDTEVASLKFHLTADAWEYPDWALFESFSPTTGDDLQLVEPAIRAQLEQVQRVEFASSPDGPYQYLCLRHNPYTRTTERVDLKDPADLRPNVSAFWLDKNGKGNRVFSIIASEEHAVHRILELLDREGIIDGSVADKTFVSSGMISRYRFDDGQQIQDYEFIDRYGRKIDVEDPGEHYSLRRQKLVELSDTSQFEDWQSNYPEFFRDHLKDISFNDFRWLLHHLVENTTNDNEFAEHLKILTWLKDYLRTLNPGDKAQGSLIDIAQFYVNQLLDSARTERFENYAWIDQQGAAQFDRQPQNEQKLVIEASEFLAEGTDPAFSLTAFLAKAHQLGWRKFILYRTRGQRLISTAAMGNGDTDDVEMDVYGSVGEYFGAFMQGGTIRLHGNAQNFCAMAMHHGELYVFGNAGKVCGYASKGGKVFIMGDIVDRCWTNSVNDSRTQDLEVMILGSATKYAGESLMGGNFFFGGLHFDKKCNLRLNERPYLGTKMLGGASRGNFVFFDPENRLVAAQYVHGVLKEFSDVEWQYFYGRIKESFELANIAVHSENGAEYIFIEGKKVAIAPENFKLIVPKGGLKGYEGHLNNHQ